MDNIIPKPVTAHAKFYTDLAKYIEDKENTAPFTKNIPPDDSLAEIVREMDISTVKEGKYLQSEKKLLLTKKIFREINQLLVKRYFHEFLFYLSFQNKIYLITKKTPKQTLMHMLMMKSMIQILIQKNQNLNQNQPKLQDWSSQNSNPKYVNQMIGPKTSLVKHLQAKKLGEKCWI